MSRATAACLLAAAVLAACGGDKKPATAGRSELRTAADSAAADVLTLGSEVSRLLDLAADYRGSHRGVAPRSLRIMGVDSLTPRLARAIRAQGRDAWVTVSFRHPEGHQYASCTGDLGVLEAAVLGDGAYTLSCTTPGGTTRSVQAGGTLE